MDERKLQIPTAKEVDVETQAEKLDPTSLGAPPIIYESLLS